MPPSQPPTSSPPAPSREQYLRELAGAIQRLLDDPTLRHSPLVAELKAVGRGVDQPLRVVVAGTVGVGKSAVLNCILGAYIVPEGTLPAPGCRVLVQAGDDWRVEATYANGSRAPQDPEEYLQDATLACFRNALAVDVWSPHELLQSMNFVDTPGFFAADTRDVRATEESVASAEALLWVTSARAPLGPAELDVLQRTARHLRGRCVCVLTRVGELTDPRRELAQALDTVGRSPAAGLFAAVVPMDPRSPRMEVSAPTVDALRRVFAHRREALKVQAAQELARGHFVRRRAELEEALAAQGAQASKVEALRRALDRVVQDHDQALRRAWERASAQLKKARDAFVHTVSAECREFLENVPEQRRRPGLLTDDYFIEWTKVRSFYWPPERVEAAEKTLKEAASKPLTTFSDECVEVIDKALARYGELLREAAAENPNARALVELIAEQAELYAHGAGQTWRKLNAYYWGGMKCGGPAALCGALFLHRPKERPEKAEVEKLCARHLPLDQVLKLGAKYLDEQRDALTRQHTTWSQATLSVLAAGTASSTASRDVLTQAAKFLGM